MSSVEESSLVESKSIPSLDLTHEPSPEPQTPKEGVLHLSEFPIKFEDYDNTSKVSRHEKHTKDVSPRVGTVKGMVNGSETFF